MLGSPPVLARAWDQSPRRRLLLLLTVLALSALPVLLLSPMFNTPFERDQGLYGVIARGWLHGAIPYRDLWDNKGPVLFLWYVAAFSWLGENLIGPRLLAALAAGAAVPFVWASGAALLDRRAGLLAALLFALSFANIYLQANANAEIFMLLPLAAGFWAFVRGARGGSSWWFAVSGVLTALAVLTKQSAAFTLPAYGLWLAVLALQYPGERRRHLTAGLLVALGTGLGLAPFFVYFNHYGALDDFWYAVFLFNFSWAGHYPFVLKLLPPLLWDPMPLVGGAAVWFLAILGAVHLWRRRDRWAWLILSFFAFSELAAQFIGKNSPHYNIQFLPAAALAGAVGLQVVIDSWRRGEKRLGKVLMVCAALSVAGAAFVYAWPDPKDRFQAQYIFVNYADDSLQAQEIAGRVAALTAPDDYIYDFGYQSDIYFLADRKPASRWVHNRAYLVDNDLISEIMVDLRRSSPALILLTFECGYFWEETPDFECYSPPPPALQRYLERYYNYAGHVHYAFLYVRRQPGPTPADGGLPAAQTMAASAGGPVE